MHVSFTDLRKLYLLIGEALELGADPLLWRRHLLEGFSELAGGMLAMNIEVSFTPDSLKPDEIHFIDIGWQTERDRLFFIECVDRFSKEGDYTDNPYCVQLSDKEELRCMSGQALLGTADYNRNPFVNEILKTVSCRDGLNAAGRLSCGQTEFHLYREIGDPPFGNRERELGELLLKEILPHINHRLAGYSEPSIIDLSPRKQQIMKLLLIGESEKLIADELGISLHTVHSHVKDLYGHFGVQSRIQLMSKYLNTSNLFERI